MPARASRWSSSSSRRLGVVFPDDAEGRRGDVVVDLGGGLLITAG